MAKGIYTTFYDNTKILAAKDKNGKEPLLYFICSRGRSLGKTFSFCGTLFDRYFEDGGQFILLTRRKKELGAIASGIFKSYLDTKHPEYSIYEKKQQSGTFSNVYLEKLVEDDEAEPDPEGEPKMKKETEHVGFVIPLAAADEIKKISSHFSGVVHILFDEFQPMEDSTYLKNEVELLGIIHTSVARGKGGGDKSSIRRVPVYFLSNCVNIFNPYFIACGILKHIQANTRLFIGDGYVYEKCMVIGAAEKQQELGIGRILNTDESQYADDNSWLLGASVCVTKPNGWGRATYVTTLVNNDEKYGVKYYPEVGLYYVDRKPDLAYPYIFNMTLDGNLNVKFIRKSNMFENLRKKFMNGSMRFQDSGVQSVILDLFT